MTDNELILALAKVVIAAAWADGQIAPEEIINLKGLLLRLRSTGKVRGIELTGQQWARLEMYLETPVGKAERERLVVELQNALRTGRHKQLAVEALRDMMAADGTVTEEERLVLAEVEAAINGVSVGLTGAMERLVGGKVHQRRAAIRQAPNRERYFDDFLRNKVYYSLARHLRQEEVDLDLSEAEQRKLGLAGGLMAKIAHIDGELSEAEFQAMVSTVQSHWKLEDVAATLVTEVALAAVNESYDTTRIMNELGKTATRKERCQFLTALFAVAAADGDISMDEHEEIRIIARGIKLTHQDFINAKLQVIRQ
jgi:uncharacterized tellurite resistance protein B-like protein